jgi:superfamily II DNA or RNA helicase
MMKGDNTHYVHGGTSAEDRERVRELVNNSDNSIIIASYGTFSTGINIPNLNNIVFASPSKSRIRVLQSIGRGLRKSTNKDSVLIYDICDDLSYKGKKNFTLLHFEERINIYNEESFSYRINTVNI